MKNFKNEENKINFMSEQLNSKSNISLVVADDYLDTILDEIDFECVEYSKEVNSDYFAYLVDKYEDNNGNIHLFVEPIDFDEDGEMEIIIENDFVIIEEGILDEDDIDKVYADEELIIVGIDDDEYIDEECEYDEVVDEYLEQEIENFIKILEENKDETDFCFHCATKNLLEEVYCVGFKDGKNSLALSVEELMNKIVEEGERNG